MKSFIRCICIWKWNKYDENHVNDYYKTACNKSYESLYFYPSNKEINLNFCPNCGYKIEMFDSKPYSIRRAEVERWCSYEVIYQEQLISKMLNILTDILNGEYSIEDAREDCICTIHLIDNEKEQDRLIKNED
jgi:hypothetical protein